MAYGASSPTSASTRRALQTPPDYPVDELEKLAFVRAGHPPSPVAMNCSGKHAAMLATCVANGWPLDTYLEADHPLQQAVRDTVADVAGEQIAAVGVDGCGAPLFALTLTALARAFSRIATAAAGHGGGARRGRHPRTSDLARWHPP